MEKITLEKAKAFFESIKTTKTTEATLVSIKDTYNALDASEKRTFHYIIEAIIDGYNTDIENDAISEYAGLNGVEFWKKWLTVAVEGTTSDAKNAKAVKNATAYKQWEVHFTAEGKVEFTAKLKPFNFSHIYKYVLDSRFAKPSKADKENTLLSFLPDSFTHGLLELFIHNAYTVETRTEENTFSRSECAKSAFDILEEKAKENGKANIFANANKTAMQNQFRMIAKCLTDDEEFSHKWNKPHAITLAKNIIHVRGAKQISEGYLNTFKAITEISRYVHNGISLPESVQTSALVSVADKSEICMLIK